MYMNEVNSQSSTLRRIHRCQIIVPKYIINFKKREACKPLQMIVAYLIKPHLWTIQLMLTTLVPENAWSIV